MAEKYEVSRRLRGSFIVGREMIQRLDKHIEVTSGASPSFAVEFKSERTVQSSVEILDDALISGDEINSMTISASDHDAPVRARVRLDPKSTEPVSYTISGVREKVNLLDEHLSNEFDGSRAWYSGLNINGRSSAMFLIALSIFSISLSFVIFIFLSKYWTIPGAFYYIILLFVMFGIPSLSSWLFPGLVFNFGRGERSYGRNRKILVFLFGTMLFGFLLNVLFEVLSNHLLSSSPPL